MSETKILLEHSPVGPSSLDRVMNCPGSVQATEGLPDEDTEYAREGNFAHHITELARNEKKDPQEYLGRDSSDTPWRKDNGDLFICDREMVNATQDYLDFIDEFGEGESFVEERVCYDEWIDNGWGTSDHILILPEKKTCVIVDFKYGKGIKVNAKWNSQLLGYALGTFQDWGDLYEIDKFIICISQPRIDGHKDRWEITTERLIQWANEKLEPAGNIIYSDNAPFKAGAWCQWCKLKNIGCTVREEMIKDTVFLGIADVNELDEFVDDLDEKGDPKPPVKDVAMDDEALGKSSLMLEEVKKWVKDTEAEIQRRVIAGKKVLSGHDEEGNPQYWKQVTGRNSYDWRDEEGIVKTLKKARLKVDQIFTKKLISPSACKTLLGAKHKIFALEKDKEGEIIPDSGPIKKTPGKPTLVRGSDSREAYKIAVDELDDVSDEEDDFDWDS